MRGLQAMRLLRHWGQAHSRILMGCQQMPKYINWQQRSTNCTRLWFWTSHKGLQCSCYCSHLVYTAGGYYSNNSMWRHCVSIIQLSADSIDLDHVCMRAKCLHCYTLSKRTLNRVQSPVRCQDASLFACRLYIYIWRRVNDPVTWSLDNTAWYS